MLPAIYMLCVIVPLYSHRVSINDPSRTYPHNHPNTHQLLFACAVHPSVQLPAGGRPQKRPAGDSPIQLISIRPAPSVGRNHRRMPAANVISTPASGGGSGERLRVVNIERLRADVQRPLPSSRSNGRPSDALATLQQQPQLRRSSRPMRVSSRLRLSQVKPFQRGEWLRFEAGPSPVYTARARANGLFRIDTLRAFPSKTV